MTLIRVLVELTTETNLNRLVTLQTGARIETNGELPTVFWLFDGNDAGLDLAVAFCKRLRGLGHTRALGEGYERERVGKIGRVIVEIKDIE